MVEANANDIFDELKKIAENEMPSQKQTEPVVEFTETGGNEISGEQPQSETPKPGQTTDIPPQENSAPKGVDAPETPDISDKERRI